MPFTCARYTHSGLCWLFVTISADQLNLAICVMLLQIMLLLCDMVGHATDGTVDSSFIVCTMGMFGMAGLSS